MSEFSELYLDVIQKTAANLPIRSLEGLGRLFKSQVTQTAAGAAGTVGAAHYGAGLDWQDSIPWALAGAGLGNRSFRNWAAGKDISGPGRFNTATNRIIGALAVKGGVPVGLSVARHVPATLESVRDTAGNVNTVTEQAAKGGTGQNLADATKNLSDTTALGTGSMLKIYKNLNKKNPDGTPMQGGVDRASSALESLASTGQQAVDLAKQYAKPVGYGAAAVGGGLVIAQLLSSISKFRREQEERKKNQSVVV